MRLRYSALLSALVCAADGSPAISQPSADQVMMYYEAANKVCQTVKEAHGTKTQSQLGAEVQAQAGGLFGRLIGVGGDVKGSIGREEFEGLSREATAALLDGDRQCRERLVTKLIDLVNAPAQQQPTLQQPPTPQQPSNPMGPRQGQRIVPVAPQQSSAERCCIYGPGSLCNAWYPDPSAYRWHPRPNITYAELNTACYCVDRPGVVQDCP